MYWFIIDIVIVMVIIITSIISLKRGFISSVIRLLGVLISIVAAVVASRLLAGPLFDVFFRENLIESVSERIGGASGPDELAAALKSGLIGILLGIFSDMETLERFFANFNLIDEKRIAVLVVDEVVRPPMESLIGMVVFVLFFFLFYSIILLLVRLTGAVNALPAVGLVNRLLGMLFGAAYGLGICYVLVALSAFFFAVTGNSVKYEEMIGENTILFAMLYRFNPVLR